MNCKTETSWIVADELNELRRQLEAEIANINSERRQLKAEIANISSCEF